MARVTSMRFLLVFFLITWTGLAAGAALTSAQRVQGSEQMVLVLTPSWNSVQGRLRLYQRPHPKGPWKQQGHSVPVVVGQRGMAFGRELAKQYGPGPVKHEGDGRSPVGVFNLGPAFGFKPAAGLKLKLDYFPLTASSVCIDDPHSRYYNQLVDSAGIQTPDWTSSEVMQTSPLYQWGAFIQYNSPTHRAFAGSCIFLHIWRNAQRGTAGCVALDEAQLRALLGRLKPELKPVIVLLSLPAYRRVKEEWNLP